MFHPFLYAMAKRAARRNVVAKGHNRFVVDDAMSGLSDDVIDTEMEALGVTDVVQVQYAKTLPGDSAVGAIGGGQIINAIIAFIQSPLGQALIAALEKMILALIGAAAFAAPPNTTEKS